MTVDLRCPDCGKLVGRATDAGENAECLRLYCKRCHAEVTPVVTEPEEVESGAD